MHIKDIEPKLNKTWTTFNTRKIKLSEMEEDHLLNIIKLLEQRSANGIIIGSRFDSVDSGDVLFGQEALNYMHYQDYVDVYNYRFGQDK